MKQKKNKENIVFCVMKNIKNIKNIEFKEQISKPPSFSIFRDPKPHEITDPVSPKCPNQIWKTHNIYIYIYINYFWYIYGPHSFGYYAFPTEKRRDSFFYLKKPFLENGLESPLIFVFILKGKTK